MLLNSLYGRLGMNPEMETHLILPSEQALKYYNLEPDIIPLNNGKELISFFETNVYDKSNNSTNVSVPISTAVTALGRIYMSKFKMMFLKLGITLYYSDTDSFDIDQLLDQIYISFKELKLLLHKNKKLEIPQEKWYRDFSKSKIRIKNEIYSLQITDNKRKLIYNKQNKFIGTKPLIINNEKIIN